MQKLLNFNLSSIIKSEESKNSSLFIFPTGSTLYSADFLSRKLLFPFDCCGGFGGDIVNYTVYVFYLVNNAV